MQLDKIIITLRQRTPWEAMDLGVMLMRKLWPIILLPWFIIMSLVLSFVIFTELQGLIYIGGFFMWLIKPLYDSMILYILSRGVFGEYLSASDVFSNYKDWIKTGLLTSVLFWRLSPSRSFNMPVHMLEGLSGEKRKQRLNILHRVKGSHSMWLTVIGVHFEYVLALTLYLLLFYLAPDSLLDNLLLMIENPDDQLAWLIIGSVIYAITLFILEPFYVAAGFLLYLNRRTQLEAWDVELDFKNIVKRVENINTMVKQE